MSELIMAKIVDPSQLTLGTEVILDVSDPNNKTIQLVVAGNLDDSSPASQSGVNFLVLFSFLKQVFKDNPSLNGYRFPLDQRTSTRFRLINNWSFADQQTIDLLRDAGFENIDGDIYIGILSLGELEKTDSQIYYSRDAALNSTTSTFDKTGVLNEPLLVFDGVNDYRSYLKVFARERGYTYSEYELVGEQALGTLEGDLYRLPLVNVFDPQIIDDDATIASSAPYTSMNIRYYDGVGFTAWADATVYPASSVVSDGGRWYFTDAGGTSSGTGVADDTGVTWVAFEGEREVSSGTFYPFTTVVEGANGTHEQIYQFMQYQLRQSSNINTGTIVDANQALAQPVINGNLAPLLAVFSGDDVVLEEGVYIDNFNEVSTNNIVLTSANGVSEIRFPFTSLIRLNFPPLMANATPADTRFTLFFSSTFDSASSTIIEDENAVQVSFDSGDLTAGQYTFVYAYDENNQIGTAGTDVLVTLHSFALSEFEIAEQQFTITRTPVIDINVLAQEEISYVS